MNALQELIDLIEIAELSQGLPCGVVHRRVQRAKYAVGEIRRLRAKINRLIRGYQDFDLLSKTEDLIEEEEI
jgi:hypothetical protein